MKRGFRMIRKNHETQSFSELSTVLYPLIRRPGKPLWSQQREPTLEKVNPSEGAEKPFMDTLQFGVFLTLRFLKC